MSDQLIQTRIPGDLYAWVEAQATRDGDSIAGWLRRLVVRERQHRGTTTKAWVRSLSDLKKEGPEVVQREYAAKYLLEHVRDLSEGVRVVRLLWASPSRAGKPVSAEDWRESPLFEKPDEHRLVLDGSPRPWTAEGVVDEQSGVVELTLGEDVGPLRPEVMKALEHVMRVHAKTLSKLAK